MRSRRLAVLLTPLLVAGLSCTKDGDVRSAPGTSTAPPVAGTGSVPGTVGGSARTFELDVVGESSDAAVASSVAVLQRRFDDARVPSEVRAAREGHGVEVRVDAAVDRSVIEDLTSTGRLRFRPVLANLPPERTPSSAGTAPHRLQTPSTLDPELQAKLEAQLSQGEADLPTTPPERDDPAATVVLPEVDEVTGTPVKRYRLGPAALDGGALERATAQQNRMTDEWEVHPVLREGPEGIDAFNDLARTCKPMSDSCPTGQIAITLDGRVISAPQIEPKESAYTPFTRDSITINGSFTEQGARSLASSINGGALLVELRLR